MNLGSSDYARMPRDFHNYRQEDFGKNTFTTEKIKKVVPAEVLGEYENFIETGSVLSESAAQIISNSIREWAFAFGATHYTHWFQPIRSCPAEKHDTFFFKSQINALPKFCFKQLIQSEADGSSLPSGGNRCTSSARAYTMWDPGCPPFIISHADAVVLYIPAFFCSWSGESLDIKLPLARSLRCVSSSATRLLTKLGVKHVTSVSSFLGLEQEFFLISKEHFELRPDLKHTGRTLFGSAFTKTQELQEFYFRKMPENVISLIREIEYELWNLGILVNTRHSEVAPCQFEVAIACDECSLSTDQNQLLMMLLTDRASKYGLSVLFHEKPFSGFNGSGKHNNWSLVSNTGINVFDLSKSHSLTVFRAFVACVIRAVDIHADLLRAVITVPGNEHRLGNNEAPPTIISVYLGDMVTAIMNGESNLPVNSSRDYLNVAPGILPVFSRDIVDRNRTSVFAFTGNRFEFRAVGSSQHTGIATTIINSIISDSILEFCRQLEQSKAKSIDDAANSIISSIVAQHGRIVFDGDGYSDAWAQEASRRGLVNTKEWYLALEAYRSQKTIDMFSKLGVLNREELNMRFDILKQNFSATLLIECKTFIDLILNKIVPSGFAYLQVLPKLDTINDGNDHIDRYVNSIYSTLNDVLRATLVLKSSVEGVNFVESLPPNDFWSSKIVDPMLQLRKKIDQLETFLGSNWPFPRYTEILF